MNEFVYAFDDQFFADCGLAALSLEEKAELALVLYDELELRVGDAISDGMTDAQLEEFELIVDGDPLTIARWLASHRPAYETSIAFRDLRAARESAGVDDLFEIVKEFVASEWLNDNRPNHQELVTQQFGLVKAELVANRDRILE